MSLIALRVMSWIDATVTSFGTARLSGDDHTVRRGHRLACGPDAPGIEPFLGAFAIEGIDDFVGDAVANLVRVAFGYGLAREKKGLSRHWGPRC